MEADRMIRMMLLEALEVKLLKDPESDPDDNFVEAEKFQWDVISYDRDFIRLKIRFENPENIGSF